MEWKRVSIKTIDRQFWAETIMGSVIIPAITEAKIKTFWFSRYDYGRGWREILFSHIPTVKSEQVITRLAGGYELKFWDFDCRADIGGQRFTNNQNDKTFNHAVQFMQACSQITLDNVHCVNGVWQPIISADSDQNPHGSVMESFHHMFWNITQCPMYVYPSINNGAIELHTHWTKRPLPIEREMEIKVHY